MKTYLERLSPKLKTVFLELFLDEVKKHSNKSTKHWFLDFVRLNIVANRPYPSLFFPVKIKGTLIKILTHHYFSQSR